MTEYSKCPRHKFCAYTGNEPGLCPICHATALKCGGKHGQKPLDNSWAKAQVSTRRHYALKSGNPLDPREASGDYRPPTDHFTPDSPGVMPRRKVPMTLSERRGLPSLMTATEVAEYLDVGLKRVGQLARDWEVAGTYTPPSGKGSCALYDSEDVVAYDLARHKRVSA